MNSVQFFLPLAHVVAEPISRSVVEISDLACAQDTIAKLRKEHGRDLKVAKARKVKRRTGPATYTVAYVFMTRRTVNLF